MWAKWQVIKADESPEFSLVLALFIFGKSPIQCSPLKGAVAYRVSSFPKKFEFVSLCSFICLQAVYQLSGPVCKATWSGCPSYSASHLHFTLCD